MRTNIMGRTNGMGIGKFINKIFLMHNNDGACTQTSCAAYWRDIL